jgi:hypothetical protein
MASFDANPHEYIMTVLEWLKEIHTVEMQKDENLEASNLVHEYIHQQGFNNESTHHRGQRSECEYDYPCQALIVGHKIGLPYIVCKVMNTCLRV